MSNNPTADRLRSFIERIETLDDERLDRVADINAVYSEAKNEGFDVPAMRRIVALRKIPTDQRQNQEGILETYKSALGME